jgi:glycosyltransferase involved in cell wall biosynthesis
MSTEASVRPEVSVVMAVRNEEIYIESAVLSILRQSGVTHELLVVDDNSTDRTLEILTALAAQNPGMKLMRNPKAGKCSAFNLGVAAARGRFVCIFAGDDLMPEGSLAARHAMVKDLPDDVPVVGLCKLVTLSSIKKFDGHVVPRGPGRGALSGVSPLMNHLSRIKMFPVPEGLPNEDTWMELSVTHFPGWRIVHSDIIGCAWRVHEGNSINMMSGFDEYNRKITARRQAFAMFLDRFGPELTEQAREVLRGLVDCERSRQRGSVLGILNSRVGLIEKLRSISIVNQHFYRARQKLYGLLSGW